MAHQEHKDYPYGKTIQVRANVSKARFPDELHAQDETYPYQSVDGIDRLLIDANVGKGESRWVALDKNLDLAKILEEHKQLKTENFQLRMENAKQKKQLENLGLGLAEGVQENSE